MIYTYAMQESDIHHIAAANNLSVHPVYHHLSEVVSNIGEITSGNVYLTQIYKHNLLV